MNNFQIRAFVRELISEAKKAKAEKKADKKPAKKAEKKDDKKEPKLPKSSGKLMDLKKEVAYLKEMASQLQATGLTEGDEQVTEVEFSNLQKFVNELSSVKEASNKLKAKLEEEIMATEAKIKAEKDKIKEMIGLVSEEPAMDKKKAKLKENKLTRQDLEAALKEKGIKLKDFIKDPKKYPEFNKYNDVTKDIIDSIYKDGKIDYDKLDEARFKKGEDVGKPGKGFAKIAKSAAKRYGSEEAGKRVAGAILKKVVKK